MRSKFITLYISVNHVLRTMSASASLCIMLEQLQLSASDCIQHSVSRVSSMLTHPEPLALMYVSSFLVSVKVHS